MRSKLIPRTSLGQILRKAAIIMPNEEIVVVNEGRISLKEETRMACKRYATDCLQHAKAPLKQLAASWIEEGVNRLIIYIQQKLAA